MGSNLKGKNLLLREQNLILINLTQIEKRDKKENGVDSPERGSLQFTIELQWLEEP